MWMSLRQSPPPDPWISRVETVADAKVPLYYFLVNRRVFKDFSGVIAMSI